ncbi:DEAD/DEAH box helicase [Leucobacter chromiireducens]|uniref:Helicase ATP-binding domain-containing protein n=1 Tax=Leucobacter chromiireducens subsp. solipictus TaxID=398235 RepID=A0ABS1SG56_9MICO|nr:DEAD/DEAH box helicase family protein [Leucobacter chromiireducens]MBL3679543.1 hypothetical protein [Leucobacter chromiireducens subsp. solipictus]
MSDWLPYQEDLAEAVGKQMDLRTPNMLALHELAKQVSHGDGREVIADLATGVGKTYLAAALIDYLAQSGVRNVLLVTPGKTVLEKTLRNFTPGDSKYVSGAVARPLLVTADNFNRGEVGDALHDPNRLKLFVFNVQTLIKPTVKANRRTYLENEAIGGALYEHLQSADDLVVIVDEHHVVRESAKKFNAAISDLGARTVVGLTATPDKKDVDAGKVVFSYSLAEAIADHYVKVPAVVYRSDGRRDLETQLADACLLRANREPLWHQYAEAAGVPEVHPVLFIVCQSIADANSVATTLRRDDMLPGDGEVLLITSESSDEALRMLADVERPESPVRAIVSVDKLKEGWDVKNIAVIMAHRALASEALTEQILGRGLRLPFGRRVGVPAIDMVDIVAHESYETLLRNRDVLLQKLAGQPTQPGAESSIPVELDIISTVGGGSTEGFSWAVTPPPGTTADTALDGVGPAELLLAQEMGEQQAAIERSAQMLGQSMPLNESLPKITFPTMVPQIEAAKFTLSVVKPLLAEEQGRLFKHDPKIVLKRRALAVQRDTTGEIIVSEQAVESDEATRVTWSAKEIRQSLLRRILSSGLVEPDVSEQGWALDLVDAFLRGADVDDESDWSWSVDHASRAQAALLQILQAARRGLDTVTTYRWAPTEIPAPKPLPANPLDRWAGFTAGAWIGLWDKSIERYAQFDSESGEYSLAQKLDDFDEVRRWQRIYVHGAAKIPKSKGGNYYPDFVVVDSDDVYWVLEAKSNRDAQDSADVQEKAADAELWIQRVNEAHMFGTWRYKLLSEAQIAAAQDWASLTGS